LVAIAQFTTDMRKTKQVKGYAYSPLQGDCIPPIVADCLCRFGFQVQLNKQLQNNNSSVQATLYE